MLNPEKSNSILNNKNCIYCAEESQDSRHGSNKMEDWKNPEKFGKVREKTKVSWISWKHYWNETLHCDHQ